MRPSSRLRIDVLCAVCALCACKASPTLDPSQPTAAGARAGVPVTSGSAAGVATAAGTLGSITLPTAGAAAPAPGNSGATSAGGSAMTGSAGAGAMAGTPAAVPAAPVLDPNTATIKMDEFTVEPGTEVFMCQDFDNPFGGLDVAVARSESTMTPGSHHLHVYYGKNSPPDQAAIRCVNPNEFRPMIHLATIAHQVSEYPAGTAAKLKGVTGLRFQSHYVNTTDKPIRASVVVKLTKVDPATVTRWVAQMHFNRIALSIPPGTGQQVTTSCTIPANFGPIGLLSAVSHMHKHAVHFVAKTSTGVPLLETTEWDEAPPMNYPQPVMLNPGDAISWTCTYQNDTPDVITYGDSALKNEMCIYIARFFSSPSGDDLECETPVASAMARSTKNVAGQ